MARHYGTVTVTTTVMFTGDAGGFPLNDELAEPKPLLAVIISVCGALESGGNGTVQRIGAPATHVGVTTAAAAASTLSVHENA